MDTALLGKLIRGENLAFSEMESAMDSIMEGKSTPAQIAGFLIALRIKGETPEEIAAAAQTLRSKAVIVPVMRPNVIDTCGTGGDHSGTFNISTAVAMVIAATKAEAVDGLAVVDLLVRSGLAPSKGEARRLVQSGGVYVNNRRQADVAARVSAADAIGARQRSGHGVACGFSEVSGGCRL